MAREMSMHRRTQRVSLVETPLTTNFSQTLQEYHAESHGILHLFLEREEGYKHATLKRGTRTPANKKSVTKNIIF